MWQMPKFMCMCSHNAEEITSSAHLLFEPRPDTGSAGDQVLLMRRFVSHLLLQRQTRLQRILMVTISCAMSVTHAHAL